MRRAAVSDDVEAFVERRTFVAVLSDGTRARIRPLLPTEKQELAEGLQHLSPTSQYLRFLQPKPAFSKRELAYLTEIDYRDHFALGAHAIDAPGVTGLGIARYVRDPQDTTVAEAALAVIDHYQRRGLGRILLQALAEAAMENGIDRFRAHVSSANKHVLESLARHGTSVGDAEGSMVSLEVPLPIEAASASAGYEVLRAAASGLARVRGPIEEATTHHEPRKPGAEVSDHPHLPSADPTG